MLGEKYIGEIWEKIKGQAVSVNAAWYFFALSLPAGWIVKETPEKLTHRQTSGYLFTNNWNLAWVTSMDWPCVAPLHLCHTYILLYDSTTAA